MSLIIPANTLASGGFSVGNSVRFNRGDSPYLSKTFSTDGTHHDKGTISMWVKKSCTGVETGLYHAGTSSRDFLRFESNDTLTFRNTSGHHLNTNRVFRDVSAFYNIVLAFDSSQGTASNRVKIYVNGVQETSFATETYPSQNRDMKMMAAELQRISSDSEGGAAPFMDGYLSEIVGIDGQQLDATSFGEFDEDSGIWKPIDVSGLTFGTNGFYLDFEDSGALGDDVSGNGNDFTVNNLTATDQSTDTCTNNFCTLSPLADSTSILSDGNCVNNADGSQTTSKGSIAVSNGRWYVECKITTSSQYPMLGIWSVETAAFQNPTNTSYPGQVTPSYGGYGNGSIYANGSNTGSQGFTWGNGNIIGIYLDLESATKTIKWYKDGSSIATLNLATTTDAFVFGDYNSANSLTASWNFGNPVFAISSGNTDANGYGNFEFSPTIGGVDYFAICTKNLAEYG